MRVFCLMTLIFSILMLAGCDKIRAKEYAGTYSCSVKEHTYELYQGFWDTLYTAEIEVINNGKSVIILQDIPVDSVKRGKVYRIGSYSHYREYQIDDDRLYYQGYSGGHGGNASITYECQKN